MHCVVMHCLSIDNILRQFCVRHIIKGFECRQFRSYYEIVKRADIHSCTNVCTFLDEACHSAILLKGFHPDDEALIYTSAKKLREMMSFTDRAKKRRYCILLTK